jgi:hypothetical protein
MFRSLVCVAMTMILLGGEIAAFAAAPQASLMDCRIAEHHPKRLRRLGSRFGAKHSAAPIPLNEEMASDNGQPSPPPVASHDPVRLEVSGIWISSASLDDDWSDQSAAALFPAQSPASQTE